MVSSASAWAIAVLLPATCEQRRDGRDVPGLRLSAAPEALRASIRDTALEGAVPTLDGADRPLALVAEAEHPQVVGDDQPGFGDFLDLRGCPLRGVFP